MALNIGQELTADRDEVGDTVPSPAGGPQGQWVGGLFTLLLWILDFPFRGLRTLFCSWFWIVPGWQESWSSPLDKPSREPQRNSPGWLPLSSTHIWSLGFSLTWRRRGEEEEGGRWKGEALSPALMEDLYPHHERQSRTLSGLRACNLAQWPFP